MNDKMPYVEIRHITKTDRVAMPYIVKKDVTRRRTDRYKETEVRLPTQSIHCIYNITGLVVFAPIR